MTEQVWMGRGRELPNVCITDNVILNIGSAADEFRKQLVKSDGSAASRQNYGVYSDPDAGIGTCQISPRPKFYGCPEVQFPLLIPGCPPRRVIWILDDSRAKDARPRLRVSHLSHSQESPSRSEGFVPWRLPANLRTSVRDVKPDQQLLPVGRWRVLSCHQARDGTRRRKPILSRAPRSQRFRCIGARHARAPSL
jgi:hypothetical protein